MIRTGMLVGIGRTAEVFEYGAGNVVKVLRPGIPAHWAEREATLTAAVHERGLPTPAVRGLVDIGGRAGVVFERIDGISMWTEMLQSPSAADRLARSLGGLYSELRAETAPAALPSLIQRVGSKSDDAEALTASERAELRQCASALGEGPNLCHGDLHPGNVLMSNRGPIIIDWYDAAAGPPLADLVRTSLLVRPPSNPRRLPPHLPGATSGLLTTIHQRFLEAATVNQSILVSEVVAWEAVLAASRLAERADSDEGSLVELWRQRLEPGGPGSVLRRDLATLGVLVDDRP